MNEAFLTSTNTKSLWIFFAQLNFIHYYYLVNVGYLQWHIMIEASVTCINTYYARARARRHTCTRSDLADWTRSGTGPVDRSHHRANWNGSGTVLVSNLWCEHGLTELSWDVRNKAVISQWHKLPRDSCTQWEHWQIITGHELWVK